MGEPGDNSGGSKGTIGGKSILLRSSNVSPSKRLDHNTVLLRSSNVSSQSEGQQSTLLSSHASPTIDSGPSATPYGKAGIKRSVFPTSSSSSISVHKPEQKRKKLDTIHKLFCLNPFNKHGTSLRVTAKDRIKPWVVMKMQAKYDNLTSDSCLCFSCALRLNKEASKDPPVPQVTEVEHEPESAQIPETNIDVISEPMSSSESLQSLPQSDSDDTQDPDFKNKEVLLQEIQSLCRLLGIEEVKTVKDKLLVQTYSTIKQAAKANIQLLLSDPQLNLSPDAGIKKRKDSVQPRRECLSCSDFTVKAKDAFEKTESREDKYKILTSLPSTCTIDFMTKFFNCNPYLARQASKLRDEVGPFSAPTKRMYPKLSADITSKVKEWYLSSEISRTNPALSGAIYVYPDDGGSKLLVAKQAMTVTLKEGYRDFVAQTGIEISMSSFSKLKPKQCVWPGQKGFHNSIACEKHQNFELDMIACGQNDPRQINDILKQVMCDTSSRDCMLGYCTECPTEEKIEKLLDNLDPELDEIVRDYWGKEEDSYGVQLHSIKQTRSELIEHLSKSIPIFARHHFVMKAQRDYIADLKKDLGAPDNAMLIVDFAMNYACVVQNSPQSFHWVNIQVTLHPCVLVYANDTGIIKKKKYVVVSDCLEHNATSFHVFRAKVLNQVKEQMPNISKIVYISDGPSSQYKNKKNIINLMYHKTEFGLDAEWHYTATTHGKSECDAAGAEAKSSARRASLSINPARQKNILSARQFYEHCKDNLDSETFQAVWVSNSDITEYSETIDLDSRYGTIKTIPGTRKCHSLIPCGNGQLKMKEFSSSEISEIRQIIAPCEGSPAQEQVLEEEILPNYAPSVSEFVAVASGKGYLVAMVIEVFSEEYTIKVQAMKQERRSTNSFKWFAIPKLLQFDFKDIISKIEAPDTPTGRLYTLAPQDFFKLESLYYSKI